MQKTGQNFQTFFKHFRNSNFHTIFAGIQHDKYTQMSRSKPSIGPVIHVLGRVIRRKYCKMTNFCSLIVVCI